MNAGIPSLSSWPCLSAGLALLWRKSAQGADLALGEALSRNQTNQTWLLFYPPLFSELRPQTGLAFSSHGECSQLPSLHVSPFSPKLRIFLSQYFQQNLPLIGQVQGCLVSPEPAAPSCDALIGQTEVM